MCLPVKMQMKQSFLAETLMNALVACPLTGLVNRTQFAVLSRLRSKLARHKNLLVRYKLERIDLLLPLAHQLPLYRRSFQEYSKNVGRLAEYVGSKYPSAPIIDIGANVGDTIAIIRAKTDAPILAIEGDEFYFTLLKQNLAQANLRDVIPVEAFVGSSVAMQGVLHRDGGTASFVEGCSSSIAPVSLQVILAEYPKFERARFLKVDTDGFDCQIVKSSLEWLAEAKPVAFIEYDPTLTRRQGAIAQTIFEDLRSIGYKYAICWQNTGGYLLTADLEHASLLEDLDAHYSTPGGYLDIAFVHEEDSDLALSIRRCEIDYFKQTQAI